MTLGEKMIWAAAFVVGAKHSKDPVKWASYAHHLVCCAHVAGERFREDKDTHSDSYQMLQEMLAERIPPVNRPAM
jgi:steroid 5-alpha reductase family enzyme